jgi:HrpA-like RNA helicase
LYSWQLLDSHTFGCSDEILTIAAMTSVQVSNATSSEAQLGMLRFPDP